MRHTDSDAVALMQAAGPVDDQLSKLTVALGLAGAIVAGSIAGWVGAVIMETKRTREMDRNHGR